MRNIITYSEQSEILLAEMMDWCFENDIEYITDLMDYAAKFRDDWSQLLSQPHYCKAMTEYLHASSQR